MKYSVAAFAAAMLVMLALTGVRLGGDSGLYIDGARRILGGEALIERGPSYAGYIGVVALCQAAGLGLVGVIAVQIGMATLAAAAIYRLASELGGATAAVVATGLLTLDLDTNRWHTFVLADSLYLSLFAVSVWLVYAASRSPRSLGRFIVASIALVAASLMRPEGWFLLPAAALFWIASSVQQRTARIVASAVLLAACALLILALAPRLSGNVAAVDPGDMLQRGQTMWDSDRWRLAMPAAEPESVERSSAQRAVRYAVRYPLETARLMVARIAIHFAHVRPNFSTRHNLFVVLWLVPVYALAGIAAWQSRNHPLVIWTGLAIASQTLVVALTHADLDGRYLAHVLPVVYPFAATRLLLIARGQEALEVRM